MSVRIDLVVIDPQRDFCCPDGSLYVPGAQADMDRLAAMVHRLRGKLADIHVTLDSHNVVDIAHPAWWKDSAGNHPAPFTLIGVADVESARWVTTMPSAAARSLAYVKALAAGGRYPHVVWPEHCLIGSEGAAVEPQFFAALQDWARVRFAVPDFITKGSNPWTEHFSAVRAEVPDPTDPTTQLNTRFIATLEEADVILLAGEARSHCLANSVRDVADAFSDPKIVEKLVLLTDASSDVPGFEAQGQQFVHDLVARGMKTATTLDFLA